MALAMLNARLMLLADRWAAFWDQPDLGVALAAASYALAEAA